MRAVEMTPTDFSAALGLVGEGRLAVSPPQPSREHFPDIRVGPHVDRADICLVPGENSRARTGGIGDLRVRIIGFDHGELGKLVEGEFIFLAGLPFFLTHKDASGRDC